MSCTGRYGDRIDSSLPGSPVTLRLQSSSTPHSTASGFAQLVLKLETVCRWRTAMQTALRMAMWPPCRSTLTTSRRRNWYVPLEFPQRLCDHVVAGCASFGHGALE